MSEGLPSVSRLGSGAWPDSASGSLRVHSSAYEERMCVRNVSQKENVREAQRCEEQTPSCVWIYLRKQMSNGGIQGLEGLYKCLDCHM